MDPDAFLVELGRAYLVVGDERRAGLCAFVRGRIVPSVDALDEDRSAVVASLEELAVIADDPSFPAVVSGRFREALRGFRRACFRAGVFSDDADPKLRAAASYEAFLNACRDLGVRQPLPRFHDLRHAFATHALAAGLSAHAVARLLGHSDPGLVWKRYGHALPSQLASAGDALSAFRRARGVT